jgi:hypothetical protein
MLAFSLLLPTAWLQKPLYIPMSMCNVRHVRVSMTRISWGVRALLLHLWQIYFSCMAAPLLHKLSKPWVIMEVLGAQLVAE